jgi:GTP-binding protein
MKDKMIKTADFLCSNTDYKKCPEPNKPEYAFIGRSNVGKSSLVNALCNHKDLAKISSKPGKTQLINHFLINKSWYMVDLPGYGYAKVSKNMREKWGKNTEKYLKNRPNLACVFVLIDSRLEPQLIDLEFTDWLVHHDLPFALVYTKADKDGPNAAQKRISEFKKRVADHWTDFPDVVVTSAETKYGIDKLLALIEEITAEYLLEV